MQCLKKGVIIVFVNALTKESRVLPPFRECPPWLKTGISVLVLSEVPFRAAVLKIIVGTDGKLRYKLQECLLLQKYGWYRGETMLRPVNKDGAYFIFWRFFNENTT